MGESELNAEAFADKPTKEPTAEQAIEQAGKGAVIDFVAATTGNDAIRKFSEVGNPSSGEWADMDEGEQKDHNTAVKASEANNRNIAAELGIKDGNSPAENLRLIAGM